MLVLSRQRNEEIVIGDNIVVTVVDIRGDKVRLGIQAPAEVPVYRTEVYESTLRENQRALSESYKKFTRYLEAGEFLIASRLYLKNPDVRSLITEDQISKLENELGRKLSE